MGTRAGAMGGGDTSRRDGDGGDGASQTGGREALDAWGDTTCRGARATGRRGGGDEGGEDVAQVRQGCGG